MDIIEGVRDKALRYGLDFFCRRFERRLRSGFIDRALKSLFAHGAGLLHFELADNLWLAFVENLKILLAKIPNSTSISVANYYPNQYQLHVHFECGRFIARSHFRGILLTLRLGGGAGGWRLLRNVLSNTEAYKENRHNK